MTEAQVNELRQCAGAAERIVRAISRSDQAQSSAGRERSDRQSRARVAASAARVLGGLNALTATQQKSSRRTFDDPAAKDSSEATPENVDEAVWNLTLDLTTRRAQSDELAAIDEAVASLQLLSSVLAPSPTVGASRIQRLQDIQLAAARSIRPLRNGPYILTNVAKLTDWLGKDLTVPPTVALCRCGGSSLKPFCDGTHVENGFDDRKDPKRVADRQDTYTGQQLTVLDNRGTCAHSGFLHRSTGDRLSPGQGAVCHTERRPLR